MLSRNRLFQILSFVLAGGLLVLALYGVDLERMWAAFRAADYRWVPPLLVLVIASNLCRAWRWNVLIDALPAPEREADSTTPPTLESSFSSVMIGYMVNYVAPRMGEVARTANMAHRTSIRFSSLFGTVVSERIFDTAVLGFALITGIGLLFNQLDVLWAQFLGPAWGTLSGLPLGGLVGGGAAALVVMGGGWMWVRRGLRREGSVLHRWWTETIQPALTSFRDGMWTLVRSPRRGAILVSTVGMWGGYLMMAYIPFRMLDLAGPYGIGIGDAWALMAIGALGLLVPTPGGIGSYHYITQQALVHLYGVPAEPAFTYAVLAHAAQFVFYTLAGGIAVLYQGTGLDTFAPSQADRAPRPSS